VFSHVRIGFPIISCVEVSVQEYVTIVPGPLLGSDVVKLPSSILSGVGQVVASMRNNKQNDTIVWISKG